MSLKIKSSKKEDGKSVKVTDAMNQPESTEDSVGTMEDGDKPVSVANTRKVDTAKELLAHQFNIDGTFYLSKVNDKGTSMTLGFTNMDYEVTITIKDTNEMGLNDLPGEE